MRNGWAWRPAVAGFLAILALGAGACGGDDEEPGGDRGGGLETVRIPAVPLTSMLPVWVARDRGYFREQGVEVKLVSGAEESPVGVPLVMSGRADLALNGPTGTLQAVGQGMPLRTVCGLTRIGRTERQDDSAIVVKASSGIDGLEDLSGKSVALTTLKGAPEWTIRAAIEKAGGNAKDVKFVQSPLPALQGLVESGKVDAAAIPDPVLPRALAAGKLKELARHTHLVRPGSPSLLFFGKRDWVDKHRRAVDGFRAALRKADAFVEDPANRDTLNRILARETKIPARFLRQVHLNDFDVTLTAKDFRDALAFMRRYGGPQKDVDLRTLLPPGA